MISVVRLGELAVPCTAGTGMAELDSRVHIVRVWHAVLLLYDAEATSSGWIRADRMQHLQILCTACFVQEGKRKESAETHQTRFDGDTSLQ